MLVLVDVMSVVGRVPVVDRRGRMALMVVVVVHLRSPRQCRIWMMGGDAPADWGVGAPLPQSQLRLPHSRCRCRSRCVVVAVPSSCCAVVVVHRRVQQHAHQLMCVHSRNVTENESASTDRRGKTLTFGLRRRRCHVQIRILPVDPGRRVRVSGGSRIPDPDPYPWDPGSKPARVTPTRAMH
jgi:hypothetical protein